MGRELKRVALNFEWPLNKPWDGYINPYYKQCQECDGSGSTMASKRLEDLVSLLMLSGDDAKRNQCHPYFRNIPLHNSSDKICDNGMLELTTGLAGRSSSFFGHDGCDRWEAINKIITAAGLDHKTWGRCPICKGDGIEPSSKEKYEKWTPTEPDSGDGYQIWETVSEGSPISPVFTTAEKLAQYMSTTHFGADSGSSYETWLKFINGPGWAPSMIMDEKGIRTGADAAF